MIFLLLTQILASQVPFNEFCDNNRCGILHFYNQIIENSTPDYGNLFIGGINSLSYLSEMKIGAVLSAIQISKFPIEHLVFPLQDSPDQNIIPYLKLGSQFIKEQLKTKNVLVHCLAGVSRSVSFVMAYLITEKKISPQSALKIIQLKRPFAEPNVGFMIQLEQYYSDLQDDSL